MIARNTNLDTLQTAAEAVGVELLYNGMRGNAHSFKLRLGPKRPDGTKKYQRTSASGFHRGRKVAAVCWHGHRDFFREVYRENPKAVFQTAIARYSGAEDFEAKFPDTAYHQAGSEMYPIHMQDICLCYERGED